MRWRRQERLREPRWREWRRRRWSWRRMRRRMSVAMRASAAVRTRRPCWMMRGMSIASGAEGAAARTKGAGGGPCAGALAVARASSLRVAPWRSAWLFAQCMCVRRVSVRSIEERGAAWGAAGSRLRRESAEQQNSHDGTSQCNTHTQRRTSGIEAQAHWTPHTADSATAAQRNTAEPPCRQNTAVTTQLALQQAD